MIAHAVAQVAWWQWALVVAAGFCLSAPVCSWLETRRDRQDRECWARIPGATR